MAFSIVIRICTRIFECCFWIFLYHPRGKESGVEKIVFCGKCQQACSAVDKFSELCYVEVTVFPLFSSSNTSVETQSIRYLLPTKLSCSYNSCIYLNRTHVWMKNLVSEFMNYLCSVQLYLCVSISIFFFHFCLFNLLMYF